MKSNDLYIQIVNELLKQTDEKTAEKDNRIAKQFNVSKSVVRRLRYDIQFKYSKFNLNIERARNDRSS